MPGTTPLEGREGDEHQQNDAGHMESHMPVIDRHTRPGRDVVIGGENDGKSKSKLDEPGADSTRVQCGVELLLQFLDLLDIEFSHAHSPRRPVQISIADA